MKHTADADLREKILQYLDDHKNAETPHFPTEYAALMYVALGTLALIHESNILKNEMRVQSDQGMIGMYHINDLREIIRVLEEGQRQT